MIMEGHQFSNTFNFRRAEYYQNHHFDAKNKKTFDNLK